MRKPATIKSLLALCVAVSLAGGSTEAHAVLAWSSAAPTVDGGDQSNFTGSSTDAGNVNGTGDDQNTYIAGDRPWQGQTFTTAANGGLGWTLDAVTFQHVQYSQDTSFWDIGPGWGAGQPLFFKIGTISGGVFTELVPESSAVMDGTFPNGVQSGGGSGLYLTLNLDTSVTLADNTEYAFIAASNAPFFEINGTSSDVYGGGDAITVTKGSFALEFTGGDRAFHANLAAVAVPEAGAFLSLAAVASVVGVHNLLTGRRRNRQTIY